MAKLIFFTFQFLLFCFALLGKKQFICGEESNSDSYDTLLKNIKFSKNDLNILLNEKLLSSIRDLITYEILAYHFKDSKPTNSYLINKIKKKILVNYPALDLNETFYENLESLIDNLKQSQGSDVEKFIQDIYDEKLDIIKQFIIYEKLYKNLESQIHDENKVLDIVYRNFSELLHNSNNDENITNDDNSVEKQYNIKNSLKESLTILQFYINIFNKFNNNLLEFKNKANLLITYHENQPQSLKYKPIANQLKEIIKTLTLRLRSDVSDLSDKYKLKLKIIERELSYIFPTTTNKHVPRIDMEFIYDKNTNLNLTDVKNKYEDIIASIDSDLNINTKNKYFFFHILILLLKKYTTWIDKQDSDAFFEKNDVKEVFELGYVIISKVKNAFTLAYSELLKRYLNLYAKIDNFLYSVSVNCAANKSLYNEAWNKIYKYDPDHFLLASDEIFNGLSFFEQKIKTLMNSNKNFKENSLDNLLKILEKLDILRFHLSLEAVHIKRLINPSTKLDNIEAEIENNGKLFIDSYDKLKSAHIEFTDSSFYIKKKISDVLILIQRKINMDDITVEFKKIKKIWKSYINDKSAYFKNSDMFVEEYTKNKNIIFPPEFDLKNLSVQTINVNKNVLLSSFYGSLCKYVINKLDVLEQPNKMYKYYSKIYNSIDIIIEYLKPIMEKCMSEYKIKRNEILKLIKVRNNAKLKGLKYLSESLALESKVKDIMDNRLMKDIYISNIKNPINLKTEYSFEEDLTNNSYYSEIETFLNKYFLTIPKWRNFLESNKDIMHIDFPFKYVPNENN